jgi:hypothetical protein
MCEVVNFLRFSDVKIGRYYNVLRIKTEVSLKHFLSNSINKEDAEFIINLGVILDIKLYGKSYDPDVCFIYHDVDGVKQAFYPTFSSSEIYEEYEPEEKSKIRVQKRTSILKEEILGNDWALRPQNVVSTQGIDISGFQERIRS